MSSRPSPPADLEATQVRVEPTGIAWVTLARPQAANSRNERMRDELARIYTWVAKDPEVLVLVLTGAGERFFCAGMDLKEAERSDGSEGVLERRDRLRANRDIEQLARFPKPTIAAINGYAVGGGCEMALACDLRVMSEIAQIGLPEVNHGLMPGGGGTQRLPRVVGLARAFEMIYLGQIIGAEEAHRIGLVNRLAPADRLHAVTAELASAVAAQPTAALRAVKETMISGFDLPLSAAIERELDGLLFLMGQGNGGPSTTREPRSATGTAN